MVENIFLFLKDAISSLGYFGVALAICIESMCIPLPSEIILPLAGFMAADGKVDIYLVNAVAAVGSLIGSMIAYLIGYYGGRPLILKFGKYILFSPDHFYKAEKTFNKYGSAAVFFGRLLPIIRTFISLPAGIAKMDIKKFLLFSFAGILPWNAVLIFLGYKLGQNYETVIHPIFQKLDYVVVGAIVLVIVLLVIRSIKKKGKTEAKP